MVALSGSIIFILISSPLEMYAILAYLDFFFSGSVTSQIGMRLNYSEILYR